VIHSRTCWHTGSPTRWALAPTLLTTIVNLGAPLAPRVAAVILGPRW